MTRSCWLISFLSPSRPVVGGPGEGTARTGRGPLGSSPVPRGWGAQGTERTSTEGRPPPQAGPTPGAQAEKAPASLPLRQCGGNWVRQLPLLGGRGRGRGRAAASPRPAGPGLERGWDKDTYGPPPPASQTRVPGLAVPSPGRERPQVQGAATLEPPEGVSTTRDPPLISGPLSGASPPLGSATTLVADSQPTSQGAWKVQR